MVELYFSLDIEDNRKLCLAPLSDRRIAASGQEIPDASGYFLYEQSGSGEVADVEVLAQVLTDEAAFRLSRMLGMT